MRRRRLALRLIIAIVSVLAASCGGPAIDLARSVHLSDVSTGWYDAGIENGKNKLVPSVTFRLKNVGSQPVSGLQLNAVFRVTGDQEELGSTYVRTPSQTSLEPGAAGDLMTLRCQFGYTGEQPRAEILRHSQFRDAKVEVFAKHGSAQWVRLGDYPIERHLLTGQ